ncbi:MAG: hypothetical protein MRY64_00060 [Hyphomonadaceae bacterium]|nr:hypothetical protein [Hyphomonadaceae bacterium]
MKALADPFSRVHPLFWPVLWVSLRAFAAWTGKLIEDGYGYAELSIEITWYGWIRVVHLDLSPERAALYRHLAGVAEADWRDVLTKARQRVAGLLSGEPSPFYGGGGRRSRSGRGSVKPSCLGRSALQPAFGEALGGKHSPRFLASSLLRKRGKIVRRRDSAQWQTGPPSP